MVFCEAGQIKSPSKHSALSILLEKVVVPVALPMDARSKRFPAFHPKTWLLCYEGGNGVRRYRFVVMSRNLTFDRSWDVCFAMDGKSLGEQDEHAKPIRDFLDFLKRQISNDIPDAAKKRSALAGLQKGLEHISFSLDSREFGNNFGVLPLGIGKNSYDMAGDALFCDDRYNADYTFHDLVVVSPFLSGSVIEKLNKADKALSGSRRVLITRRSELSKLKKEQADHFDIFVMNDRVVDGEQEIPLEEGNVAASQDIHAKLYLRRKYSDVDLYLGSMNASYFAIHRNVEMMVWLRTKNRYLNADILLNDLFCGPEEGDQNPFVRARMEEIEEKTEKDPEMDLEKMIKELCRLKRSAFVEPCSGKYQVTITIEGLRADGVLTISPINSTRKQPLHEKVVFDELELLQLSEFYVVTADGENPVSRIVTIPTVGIPEEREQAIVRSVIKHKRTFVEYIAFLLGDDHIMALMESKRLEESGVFKSNKDVMPALYEKMLKSGLENKEKLKDIAYVLRMVSDSDIIPDDFRETYELFCKTLKI